MMSSTNKLNVLRGIVIGITIAVMSLAVWISAYFTRLQCWKKLLCSGSSTLRFDVVAFPIGTVLALWLLSAFLTAKVSPPSEVLFPTIIAFSGILHIFACSSIFGIASNYLWSFHSGMIAYPQLGVKGCIS